MFNKILSVIIFVSVFVLSSNAQVLSPQPTCVSVVQPNGWVTISWITPIDPLNQFVSFTVYTASALAGPYTLKATLFTYSQTSYTDNAPIPNGNAGIVYYYVQTNYNAGAGIVSSSPIDTVKSMHLLVVPIAGTAVLSWNAIHTPLFATSSGIYNIYQEFPVNSNIWTLSGTTTNLNFVDTIFVCNAQLNYRVEMTDNTGCTSVSSVAGGLFQNIIVPATPCIDTLSVNNNNNATIGWNASPSADATGYVIYVNIAGSWTIVDSVFGINSTNYTYLLSTASSRSEPFRIATFDSCGNISPMGCIQSTIYLTTSPNICAHTVTLNWTAYPNIGTGLAGYRIYQSSVSASGPYVFIGGVPAGTGTFTSGLLTTGTTYYFKVEAFDFSFHKTAASNKRSYYCPSPIPPNFLYLVNASVGSANRVDVTAFVDTAASVLGYKILRATTDLAYSYSQIGMVPAGTAQVIMFSDYNADTDNKSYYYKIVNIDSCGFDGKISNLGKTIHLSVKGNEDFTNTITWNKYKFWSGKVANYNIYRGFDGILDPLPLITTDSLWADDTTIVDNVFNVLKGDGNFYYVVEAVESGPDSFNFAATSRSNIAIAKQEVQMFVPTAFTPDQDINKVFIPVGRWSDYFNYEMMIYDRFGELIFSSKTFSKGWDGTYKGNKAEGGSYVYTLKYNSSNGDSFHREGVVTLVR